MPAGQEMCCGAQEVALKLLPLHDFVPMDLRQVLVESVLGFIFKLEQVQQNVDAKIVKNKKKI